MNRNDRLMLRGIVLLAIWIVFLLVGIHLLTRDAPLTVKVSTGLEEAAKRLIEESHLGK